VKEVGRKVLRDDFGYYFFKEPSNNGSNGDDAVGRRVVGVRVVF
jgi:hypothetical protein